MLGIRPENVLRLGRLAPGKLFLVDLEQGRIVEDAEVKARGLHAGALRASGTARTSCTSTTSSRSRPTLTGVAAHAARASSRSATRRRTCASCMAPMAAEGRGADRLDGQRRRAGRPLRPPPAAVQLLQAALRAGHQPADRPDPRGGRHVAGHGRRRRAEPARRDAGARPPARDVPADPAQPRARDAAPGRARRSSCAHTIDITWPIDEGPDGLSARLASVCDEAHDALAAASTC